MRAGRADTFSGRLVAGLFGAIMFFAAGGACAEGPLQLSGTQLEPIKWSEVAGWTGDDHLAAFAAYQASCRALRKVPRSEDRGQISAALWNVCRDAMGLRPRDANAARAFFEQKFLPVRISRLGEVEGLLTGYFEPIVAGSRFPNPEFHVPLYRRPRDLVAAGYNPASVAFPNKGVRIGRRNENNELVPLPRPRRDRGRRARWSEARDMLAEGSVRSAHDPNRRLRARHTRGWHAAAGELRLAQRLSL